MTEKTLKIRKLREEGKTYKEISEITGLSGATISYHIDERGKQKVYARNKITAKRGLDAIRLEAGDKCELCGYNDCKEALEFHHLHEDKNGNISNLIKISLQLAREEAKKCVLLCCRCHREIHNGHIDKLGKVASLRTKNN